MKVFSIVINNLSNGIHCGEVIKQGTLGLVVDSINKNRVYKRYGDVLVSNTDGVWSGYTINNNDRSGFGGRETTLSICGESPVFKNKGVIKKTFKGTLWDTAKDKRKCIQLAGCELVNVSLKLSNDQVFCGGYLVSVLELKKAIGHLIVFSGPTMNSAVTIGENTDE